MSLLIVSEHPSLNEAGAPFTNGLWKFFKTFLRKAGISPEAAVWANVSQRPAASMFSALQKGKAGSLPGYPYVQRGFYIRPEVGPDIKALLETIRRMKPNLILCVGELPLTVLTHQNSLKFARGRVTTTHESIGNIKVLPTWHPRAVMADVTQEPILFADLKKAAREMAFPEVRRPQRFIHLRPTIEDLESFWQTHIVPSTALSIDIETKGTMITCVGVAPSPQHALVVPFYDEEKPNGNYWATSREEHIAWDFIRRVCAAPGKRVFGQNFSYDAQYLWREMGIPVPGWTDDTMLMHHAMQPEMEKGLGFLASIYSDELAWKKMVKHRAASDRSGKKGDE